MAVYFNPFGAYTTGKRQGQRDELELQQNKRSLAAQDFNLNNTMPLNNQLLQNTVELGNATLDNRKQLSDIGLDRARGNLYEQQLGLGDQTLLRFGVTDPLLQAVNDRYGYTFEQNPNTGNLDIYGIGGGKVGSMANPNQSLFDYANQPNYAAERAFQYQMHLDKAQQRQNAIQSAIDAIGAKTYRRAVMSRLQNNSGDGSEAFNWMGGL